MPSAFTSSLLAIIAEKHLLKHPFYQLWEKGELPLEVLARYAEQYYHLESNFPIFLSAMHAVSGRAFDVRQAILENLYDEEHGESNHRELWQRFGESVGATREAMQTCEPLPETREAVETFKNLCGQSMLSGAGALSAYESQMPAVSKSKIAGLKKHYQINDPNALKFFEVHSVMDEAHSDAWWNAIDTHAKTDAQKIEVIEAVQAGRDLLWKFLNGIMRVYMPHVQCT